VLVLSVVSPAVLVLALTTLQAWHSGRDATERALLVRAEAVAAAVAREIDLARVTLQVLATSPFLASGDLEGFHGQIATLPRPASARILLTDASGQTLLNSRLPHGTALPPRANFERVAGVFQTGKAQVSDFYTGRATREPLVAIDVPARNAAGQITHAVSIVLGAQAISQVLEKQNLPSGWTAAVLDRRGVLIGRSRAAERFIGREAVPRSRAAIAAGTNPFSSVTQEGTDVRGAHAAINETGWTAVVVVTQAELEAPLRTSVLVVTLGSSLLLLLGLITATWHANRIGRSVLALAEGAAALGHSAMPRPAPRGVREATRASIALRRAARSLARRRHERDIAERRRSLVVAELNHRVKNMLATVQAIAAQTLRGTGGDPARFIEAFTARLKALARAHDLLTSNAWEDMDLSTVVKAALAPWLAPTQDGKPPAISVRCACTTSLNLRPIQAQALVLALHELATNAAKYGALSRPAGQVEVWCGPGEDGMASLRWIESGGPPIEASPERRGFGTRLLERGLARDLGTGARVELCFEPGGLRAFVRFPPGAAASRTLEPV
jgi:two-component sensor histidine kinase